MANTNETALNKKQAWKENIQRFGRSLLLPIGIMAPVGLLLGLSGALTQGYMIEKVTFLNNDVLQTIFKTIRSMSNIIFGNIPLMFAMGVAYGMSKKDKGIAVFSSVMGYLILIASINTWLGLTGNMADSKEMAVKGQIMVLGMQTLNVNVLGGIIAGLIGSWATDRFYNLELPTAFAFFAGRKSVPLITMIGCIIVGFTLPFLWQYFVTALSSISHLLLHDILGPILNTFTNRLLIPFGLHHVWNAMLRFTPAGGTYMIEGKEYIGYLSAENEILFKLGPNSPYWEMMPKLTRFGAQNQMVRTLFMFPAIGLAMYQTAYEQNKKLAKGLIITVVLTAVLGNVTEPLEFTFLFIAPMLYILYCGISTVVAIALHFMGTAVGYIRGTIFDFIIFGPMYENSRWYNIVIVGIFAALASYFLFKWYIVKFDVKTPGREEDASADNELIKNKQYDKIAALVIEAMGGKENITSVENCITRLRMDFKDKTKIDRAKIRETGSTGVFFPSGNHIHVVFGPMVEFIRNAVDEEMAKK
ncbi:PTS trehalose transporter subunit IIC [Clostridiales bacterium COT073_COT-073]|nr:PTS trehalose transporter subunit IIC [Clostridiales bacterium COT073_COT-073]